MASDNFVQLLEELRDKTKAGKVQWNETADEDAFRTNIGSFLVRVAKNEGSWNLLGNTKPWYEATLLNSEGRELDEVRSHDKSWIVNLFDAARISALDADAIAAQLLERLRDGNVEDTQNDEDSSHYKP